MAGTRVSIKMKIQLARCFFLLTIFLTMPLWARSHNRHPAKEENPSDPGYVLALGAADHFLHAWQTGDAETGMVLLSNGLRHSQNSDTLEEFFSNATKRAFEITRGRGHQGLYSFPVVLVTIRGDRVARKFSEIILIEAGKNDWVVDKLP